MCALIHSEAEYSDSFMLSFHSGFIFFGFFVTLGFSLYTTPLNTFQFI